MTRFFPFLLFAMLISSLPVHSQSNLFIDTTYTAEEMVNAFFSDSDVAPSNVVHTGSPLSYGFFDAGDTDMDINAGIFLSTGSVLDAANTASYFASSPQDADGDLDLEAQVNDGFLSFDASILEMDITPSTDSICFYYVFASEEYPEWVFTSFNDVFAFFISGGPEYDTLTNIASIPDSDPAVAVSINTINQNLFSNYYTPQYTVDPPTQPGDYLPDTDLAYDGMTVLLPAKAYVTPGETYHIKIGITDVSDAIFDSGVFIGIQSLGGDSLLTPIATADLNVQGDSLIIENESMFAKTFSWDFGDGNTSVERHPDLHVYEEEGTYNVELTVSSWCCSATYTETVEIGASAAPVAAFNASTEEACTEAAITFTDLSTGNISSWEWSFPGGNPASSTDQNPSVTYETAGQYNVTLLVTTEDGQSAAIEMAEFINIQAEPVAAFESTAEALAVSFLNTSTHADTYLWDFGDGNQSTEENPQHIYNEPGTYTVSLSTTNACGEDISTNELNLVVNSTENEALSKFEFYPNPIIDQLIIEPGDNERYSYSIFSADGRKLAQRQNLRGKQVLSMAALEKGVYLLQIEGKKGNINEVIYKQ